MVGGVGVITGDTAPGGDQGAAGNGGSADSQGSSFALVEPNSASAGSGVMTPAVLDLCQTRRFVELVYPNTVAGKLSLCWSNLGREGLASRQFDRGDLDSLCDHVAALDAAGIPSVYLRVTTVRADVAPGRRGGDADSVEYLGPWADLDFGTQGHAHDVSHAGMLPLPPDEAWAAKIVGAACVPSPTFWVHSGGGLYPYWLLDYPFTLTDDNRTGVADFSRRWQAVLAAGARSLGLHYGTGVGDLSRVLRLAGTVNRKPGTTARPCRIVSEGGHRYTTDTLWSALLAAEQALGVNPNAVGKGARRSFTGTAPHTGTPLDDFESRHDWSEIIEPVDWTELPSVGGTRYWTRPGKEAGISASTGHEPDRDRMYVFSDSPDVSPLETHKPMTKPYAYALLYCGGDLSAAAARLYDLGYGARRESGAASTNLPESFWAARPILGHIRQAAHSHGRSADLTLYMFLAREAAMIDPSAAIQHGSGRG